MPLLDFEPDFAGSGDYARLYRSMGIQVVPALTPDKGKAWKLPAVSWKSLQNELVPELTFERWYGPQGEHIRRQNMGIITGKASNNVFVVDVDLHRNSDAASWWQYILDQAPNLTDLETVSQTTGGGGKQYLFRAPADWTPPTFKTSIGVDIRGQGGFAVMPPSMHESGKPYKWDEGFEPWSVDIADASPWLCAEIDQLAERYGGRTITQDGITKTATPDYSTNAFGAIVDGREDYMTKFVWGWIVNLRREAPMINDAFMNTQCNEAFSAYQTLVKSRLPYDGKNTNAELLEMEGRGITAFKQKWQYAAKQWETKVSDHARTEPPKKASNPPFDPSALRFDPETGEILGEYPNPDLSIDDEFAPAKEPADSFRLIPASQLVDEPVKWLIKDLIPANSLASLYGKPGTYKSFVALYMASHIALGLAVFGRNTEQGDVVYIAGEGGAGLKKRYEALRKRHNLPDIHNLYFLKRQLNLRSKMDDLARLIKEIKSNNINPKLIVIDTLARAFSGGNENSSEDMGAFIAMVGLLQQATSAAVLLVHHSGKDEARGQRGHSSLLGAVDAELELMKLSEDDSIHRIGQLTTTKQKDGEDGIKFTFHMETIHLSSIDPENTSLALVPVDEPKTTARKKIDRTLNANDKVILAALKMALNDCGEMVGIPQIPPNTRVVNVNAWRQFYYAGNPNGEDTKRKTFARAVDRLVSCGTVESWANYCWISNT